MCVIVCVCVPKRRTERDVSVGPRHGAQLRLPIRMEPLEFGDKVALDGFEVREGELRGVRFGANAQIAHEIVGDVAATQRASVRKRVAENTPKQRSSLKSVRPGRHDPPLPELLSMQLLEQILGLHLDRIDGLLVR